MVNATSLDPSCAAHKNTRISSSSKYIKNTEENKFYTKTTTNDNYKQKENTNSMLGIPSGFLLSTSITDSKEGLLKNNPSNYFTIQKCEIKNALKTYLLEAEKI